MTNCFLCDKNISSDEIGLNKKLISRETTKYMCKTCLAKYFGVSEELLDKKVEEFKRSGCALFCTAEQNPL